MEEFIANNGLIALLILILPILTGVKQALKKYEETSAPGWLPSVIKVVRKVLEYATANDGQSDQK